MKKNSLIRNSLLIAAITLILASCAKSTVSQGFDWPRWGGPDGNLISKETGWNPRALSDGPRVLWNINVGLGHSNIAIKDNRLYTIGFRGTKNTIYCLNAETGKAIWKYQYHSYYHPQPTPTVDGSSVYILSSEGILFCLNIQNGRLRWKKNLVKEYGAAKPVYGFAGSPVVVSDLLLINVKGSGMALNKQTGQLVWASEKPTKEQRFGTVTGTDYSTPVIYKENGKQLALFISCLGLSSVDAENGKLHWVYEWEYYWGDLVPDPVVLDNRIYIANEYVNKSTKKSALLEFQGGGPIVRWKNTELHSDVATPVVLDGYIYGCHGGSFSDSLFAYLRCIELETGKVMWEYPPLADWRKEPLSLMAADGKLILLTNAGTLSIAEATPAGYKEISKCDVYDSVKMGGVWSTPPVLCNGRIYCRNFGGELLCLDVSR